MSDYFERVERQLLDAVQRHAAAGQGSVRRVARVRLSRLVLVANAVVIVVGAMVLVAVLGHRGSHRLPVVPAVPHRGVPGPRDVAPTPSYGPTLSELLHNFAFLRRPQTSSDRSGAVDAACGCRLQYMRHLRDLPGGNRLFVGIEHLRTAPQVGAAGGVQLSYFVMEPNGNSYGASWSGGFYDALPDE